MKNVFIVILETTPLSGMASITRGVVKRNEFNKMTIHQNLYRIFEKETKAKQFDKTDCTKKLQVDLLSFLLHRKATGRFPDASRTYSSVCVNHCLPSKF